MFEEKRDDEYEEDEILIFVEIDGLVATEALDVQAATTPFFKIMGLDTDTPFMQLGNEHFSGEFTEPMGSTLLFEVGDTPAKTMITPLLYFGKTSKHVVMRRAFLHQKIKDETETIPRPPYLDEELLATLPDKMVAEYLSLDQTEAKRRLLSGVADIDETMTRLPDKMVAEDLSLDQTEAKRSLLSGVADIDKTMTTEVMKQQVSRTDDPTPGPSRAADPCVVEEDVTTVDPGEETTVTEV